MKKISCYVILFFSGYALASAQPPKNSPQDETYARVVTERSHKIIATLGVSDSAIFYRVREIVAGQYKKLNDLYIQRDAQKAEVKKLAASKDSISFYLKTIEEKLIPRLDSLHRSFIAGLSKELNEEQVSAVKDGMTYSVLQVTYKGYLAMLPELTEPQKSQIMKWLVEAREHAMDAESSEKKHAWFGKYKGRINNYLSAAGYDLKKAGKIGKKKKYRQTGF